MLLEIPTCLTQNAAILMYCYIWHHICLWQQQQYVHSELLQLAHPSSWDFVIVGCQLQLHTLTALPQDQLNRIVCGFNLLFTCFWLEKSLLPLFDIELRFLAVPACSLVTVLRLSQLDSSNGRTASIFQTLLIAQASSGWWQQKLLTCCFD